jgi:hypothetical protein
MSSSESQDSDDILKLTMAQEGLINRHQSERNLECAFSRLSIGPLTVRSLFMWLAFVTLSGMSVTYFQHQQRFAAGFAVTLWDSQAPSLSWR